MVLSKYIIALTTLMTVGATAVYAEADGQSRFSMELEESDMQVLNDFINSKRKIPLIDKSKKLKISGEIHTEWNYFTEKINGRNVRVYRFQEEEVIGSEVFLEGERLLIGHNDYDIQADLFVDWDTDRTWARMHLRFDNSAGVDDNGLDPKIDVGGYHGSGSANSLNLKEAYVGYEILKSGNNRLTIELGRRGNIYKAFYSELQFGSRLDGVILKLAGKWKNFSDWYVQWAGFVVDERATHYAWATEVGLLDIKQSGLDLKYSYVDWHKHGINRYFKKDPEGFRFKVSQVSMIFRLPSTLVKYPVQLFAGMLYNHTPSGETDINVAGHSSEIEPSSSNSDSDSSSERPRPNYIPRTIKIGRDQNMGGFAGFQINEIYREGDWVIRGLIAFCEAQCIPDNDVRNIGTGNFLRQSFTAYGRGNTNWQGYALKFGYAITNNWVIETQYDHSWSIDNQIAGTHGFTRYCLETTYSF